MSIKRREFVKQSAVLASVAFLPSCNTNRQDTIQSLRTAHIGIGGMGKEDLSAIASHPRVSVTALCDVDSRALAEAQTMFPNAKIYKDYRIMLNEIADQIDAVIVSTPDHTHAPASMMAMNLNKAVYCQKPLTHHISEARAMRKIAEEKKLVTQMGIQVHSFYDYKLGTILIQNGIIGKVNTVIAWSPKNWGYDGPSPEGEDGIPEYLDWHLWLGTSQYRPYKEGFYHPGNWRKLLDYGCGTLGDMGVHIFDTPYNALALGTPYTVMNSCRESNGYGFPEKNIVTYEFPGTPYTTEKLTWIWHDGEGAPADHPDLRLPDGDTLPEQGAMFIGEKGKLLLPHFMEMPRLIVDGNYQALNEKEYPGVAEMGDPVRDYMKEGVKHYHQFVDACLGAAETSAPFSYAAQLTETILLGVIAGRFPNRVLNWDSERALFKEEEVNALLDAPYREF